MTDRSLEGRDESASGVESTGKASYTPQERLLLLDIWQRSELPLREFASAVRMSADTLYSWRQRFRKHGPAGLQDQPRGAPRGSRLPEATRRAILMLKQAHPEWGIDRIHDTLLRSEGYGASSGAIQRVLEEAGYEVERVPTRPHGERESKRFERARPNQLWQSDLFSFVLKPQTRRVSLVVFLDDHSRFVVGHGVNATSTCPVVLEALKAAIHNFGPPEELLTDNGPPYRTWRGKSGFSKALESRGIRHLKSRPRHPQTLGKTERFWRTLWEESIEAAVFEGGLEDARERVRHFIDYYNFQRTHQGIEGLVPADRFFSAAPEVRKTMESRVAANALDLARHGKPRQSVYLTGRVGDEGISLHGEGGKLVLSTSGGAREEIDLGASGKRAHPAPPAPEAEGGV